MIYLDAGTTYSKIISDERIQKLDRHIIGLKSPYYNHKYFEKKYYYIAPSSFVKDLNLDIYASCGHMINDSTHENEIVALAKGCSNIEGDDITILDLGSRDAKWINLKNRKFHDMDWNTSCASSTGATVEMLLKFYDLKPSDLAYNKEKYTVTCGIFGLEKIMDDISSGIPAKIAVSKFVHGIAYNAWNFAKKPDTLYLSGGFCENKCFTDSLSKYCDLHILGRFKLCEGLINEQ